MVTLLLLIVWFAVCFALLQCYCKLLIVLVFHVCCRLSLWYFIGYCLVIWVVVFVDSWVVAMG